MANLNKQELVRAWILLHHADAQSQVYKDNFWAFTELSDLCRDSPEVAWQLIEAIRESDGSEVILANLAAGPLESILVRHGDQFISKIESLAASDSGFRKMLGAIWKNNIADDVWDRLKRVSGPTF